MRPSLRDDDPRHGSNRGYQAGCRKFCCRLAHAAYNAERKMARGAQGVPEHVHGTRNGYVNYSCHCDRCQVASIRKPKNEN